MSAREPAPLVARRFVRELRSGSSLPLIVEADDGARYVAKLRGAGEGASALAIDWIASRVGLELGLPIVGPRALRIEPGFEREAADPEIVELIERSHGLAFATPWFESSRPATPGDVASLPRATRDALFAFDLWLVNVDRHERNLNAIVVHDEFQCLDYSASIALRGAWLGREIDVLQIERELRGNPFFASDAALRPTVERFTSLRRERIASVIESLPSEWLTNALHRGSLFERLSELLSRAPEIARRFERVVVAPLESAAERAHRADASKAAFRERHGKL